MRYKHLTKLPSLASVRILYSCPITNSCDRLRLRALSACLLRSVAILRFAISPQIKDINELMQRGEIDGKDIVARSRYCFGRDFEGLHQEYLGLLKKLGIKLK